MLIKNQFRMPNAHVMLFKHDVWKVVATTCKGQLNYEFESYPKALRFFNELFLEESHKCVVAFCKRLYNY